MEKTCKRCGCKFGNGYATAPEHCMDCIDNLYHKHGYPDVDACKVLEMEENALMAEVGCVSVEYSDNEPIACDLEGEDGFESAPVCTHCPPAGAETKRIGIRELERDYFKISRKFAYSRLEQGIDLHGYIRYRSTLHYFDTATWPKNWDVRTKVHWFREMLASHGDYRGMGCTIWIPYGESVKNQPKIDRATFTFVKEEVGR